MVVGTSTATCFPSITHLKAARRATSVLPNPTSPHKSLSMGQGFSISLFISRTASSCPSVSSYSKLLSNSLCHSLSAEKAYPGLRLRSAYSAISSFAISFAAFFARDFFLIHSLPPIFERGTFSLFPVYFDSLSSWSHGRYRESFPAYLTVI